MLQKIDPAPDPMTIEYLTDEYQKIVDFFNERWPMLDKDHRIFARTMKLVEELGELSDEILASMNLQRSAKMEEFTKENVRDEFADVLATVIMLGIELEIDIPTAMQRKIQYTHDRFIRDREDGATE